MDIKLPYLNVFSDRHGRTRAYYRRSGQRIPIQGEAGSPEFLTEYAHVHQTFETPVRAAMDAPGTFGHLVAAYLGSAEFDGLRDSSKTEYRRHLERAREKLGKIRLTGISKPVVIEYRDSLRATPRTANNALAYLKQLLNFAVEREMIPINPAASVKRLRDPGEGWQPWPAAALERFAADSKGAARIAFYLGLYTGQRRADCLAMRWGDITNRTISVRQQKTGARVQIPIDFRLEREIEAARQAAEKRVQERAAAGKSAALPLTIVHRQNGQPYTDDGFGTIWNREQHRLQCNGLPFHGLRKNAVIALLEVGCSRDEVMAITGHATDEMVTHYSRQIDQGKMAARAIAKRERPAKRKRRENEERG